MFAIQNISLCDSDHVKFKMVLLGWYSPLYHNVLGQDKLINESWQYKTRGPQTAMVSARAMSRL